MQHRHLSSRPGHPLGTLAVLTAFLLLGLLPSPAKTGDDLAASYLGCRLIATHNTASLYSYDPTTFSEIDSDDDAWHAQAQQTGFTGYLHPYVQTPLWAWSLQPLCTHLPFAPFRFVFTVLNLLSFFGIAWLVARFWAPSLFNPLALALLLLVFSRSEPFRYAMVLSQTHVLYVLLTIASILLAERRRPGLAGILLGLAAAVKITPGFLIVYWLLTRRYRAALSAMLASAILLAAAVLFTGPTLFSAYLTNLHRVSNVLLVSENNQSFAAWLMGRYHPTDELDELITYVLPPALRIGSNLLVLVSIVVGGLLDRRPAVSASDITSAPPPTPPLGAMFAIVGVTLFTPIAWTHYYIVLLPPIMLLLNQFFTASSPNLHLGSHADRATPVLLRRPYWLLAFVIVIALLNLRPIAPDIITVSFGPLSLIRSNFYSGVLCLVALALAARHRMAASTPTPATSMPSQ